RTQLRRGRHHHPARRHVDPAGPRRRQRLHGGRRPPRPEPRQPAALAGRARRHAAHRPAPRALGGRPVRRPTRPPLPRVRPHRAGAVHPAPPDPPRPTPWIPVVTEGAPMPTEPARNPALDDEPDPREVWRWVRAAVRPWLGWVL